MTARRFVFIVLQILIALDWAAHAAAQVPTGRSRLAANTEPGAMYLEDILPKPVRLTVTADSIIYYQADLQRALGSMAKGSVVQLVAMTDTLFKVRGRARHGDVAGWMRLQDLNSPDPNLAVNLKKFYDRQKKIDELIKNKQVAIGMTSPEVKASLGEPQHKTVKITAEGKQETLEYVTYKNVPQVVTGRDSFGNLVQNTTFVKVESGKLSLDLKGGSVVSIEETQGNPLGNGGVQIVPGPVNL